MAELPFPNAGKPNWANQTIWTGDNLDIMRGMNSESVDLIYLDPPFNSKHDYSAPIGSKAAGAAFKDTWGLDDVNLAWHGEIKHDNPGLYDLLNATRFVHGDSMMSYLMYMAIRLMEMRRLLTLNGSIYLHCDPTASHYLKMLMDSIFGRKTFRNEVVWFYPGREMHITTKFNSKHDVLLFYAKGQKTRVRMSAVALPYDRSERLKTLRRRVHKDETGREWVWETRGQAKGQKPYRRYVDEIVSKGRPLSDVWADLQFLRGNDPERTGYPTQKPLSLLRRVIAASSDEGGTVLDPFCGCATACIAAEQLGRRWVGIDISPKAADLVRSRMQDELGLFYRGAHREDIPRRTDIGRVLKYNDAKNKRYLYGEQGGYCLGCEEHFPPRNLTVDHIIPKSRGGTDHISNLQLLCGACNSVKGDRPHEYLLAALTDKGHIKRRRAA
ncbi:MAG: hypothetical protein F4X39_04840 [Acidobacteriia bacterium]|nr:hypothetical protein [Terriglobia bacterium]